MPVLSLYYKPTCPFCHKVLNFMEANKTNLTLKNISESEQYRNELIQSGGKQQVPALDIDGKIMYESDDIINYLRGNSS